MHTQPQRSPDRTSCIFQQTPRSGHEGDGAHGRYTNAAVGSVILLLLVFALRLWGLTATSIWYDEAFMLAHVREGIIPGILGLFQEDNALPLYGLLLAIWVQLVGDGEFAVRYLSVLLGTVGAPFVLKLSQAISARRPRPLTRNALRTGLGSVLAYATLPILVYYSQEVRMYALAIPLSAAFAWAGWRLATRGRGEVAYVILGILMLMAHLYTALMWAAIGLWGVLTTGLDLTRLGGRRRQTYGLWMRANIILGVLTLPVVVWAYWRLQTDATAVITIPIETLRWLPLLFGVGQYLSAPWPMVFAIVTGLTILVAVAGYLVERQRASALWLLITLTLPVALLLSMTLVKAKWSERYLLPSWGISLVVALGIGWESLLGVAPFRRHIHAGQGRPPHSHRLARILRGSGALLMSIWVILVMPALAYQAEGTHAVAIKDEWHPRPDFRGVARYIEDHNNASDVIVVIGGYATSTLEYYYRGPAKLFGLPANTRILDTRNVVDLDALRILEHEVGAATGLWLVLWQEHLADPTNLVQSVLVQECGRQPVYGSFMNVGLLHFDIQDCRPLDQLATPAVRLVQSFSVPIDLEGYDLIRSGNLLEVRLWWHSSGLLTENYTVFVHLVGPDDTIMSQHDNIAGADTYPTSMWQEGTRLRDRFFLKLPDTLSPNSDLKIGLYTPAGRVLLKDGGDAVSLDLSRMLTEDLAP